LYRSSSKLYIRFFNVALSCVDNVDSEIFVSFKFFRPKIIHSYVLCWNFKRNLVETPNEMSHFRVLEWPQIWMTFYFNFFHCLDNEVIVSFKFFRPKIIHSYVLGWNFKRNLVETPNEMSHFRVLEGPQIWMTFYFNFFHCVDNEVIVSFKFFRPKIIHSYVLGWKFKRNLVETSNGMSHFRVLEGPQIWMTFYFNFFHCVDNEVIVSFKFFRPKIIHSYVLGWNFKRNLVETPNDMSHFRVLEGPQIWMTFYFNFFHCLDNEVIVSFKFFRPKIIHSYVLGWNFKRNLVETSNGMSHFRVLEGPKIWMTFYFNFFHCLDNEVIVSFKFFRPKIIHSYVLGWNFKRNLVETPNEMSHFRVLEGPQIWMTFYFNFFHCVDNNEVIVSFKFFRPKIIHSYVLGWKFKRNLVETPNGMSHFHVFEGLQIWMNFYFYFF
jgi:hypothetical protein